MKERERENETKIILKIVLKWKKKRPREFGKGEKVYRENIEKM